MRKRAIGLELTDQAVYLVEVRKDRGQVVVHRGDVLQIPPDLIVAGELKDLSAVTELMSSWVRDGVGYREIPAIFGVSGIQAFIRKFTIPKVPVKELDQIVLWEGENILPYRIQEVVYNYQILKQLSDGYEVLFVAVHQERINPYFQLIKGLKIPVQYLTLQPFGLANYTEQVGDHSDFSGIIARLRSSAVDLVVYLQGEIELIRTAVPKPASFTETGILEFFISEIQSTLKHLQATREVWLNTGLFFGEDEILQKIRAKMPAFHWRHAVLEGRSDNMLSRTVVQPDVIYELPCALGLGLMGVAP